MPRLAYLFSRFPVVSQTFCDSEMLALESMGFDLEIVSLNPPPDSFRHERLDRLRAEVHYPPPNAVLDARARGPEFRARLGELIADHEARYGAKFKAPVRARNAWHFAPLLRRLGVGHVHVHFANRATHTALFLRQLGFTYSFTAHAQDFMVDLGSNDLLREMARGAEFVVGVSDWSRELLAKICPDSASKIVRIYNGIELDDFPAAQPDRPGALRLLAVGRLIEFKGFHHLLEAVTLLNERGVGVELRLIGEGPMRGQLEQMISAHGLLNVRLLGVRSQRQIQRELGDADVFVLPSIVDNKGACDILPTVIAEAMACRLPVVSTRIAGIPEMVSHGETGLLVEPGDAQGLAEALMELKSDPARRRSMGEAGRRRAERLFALGTTAPQIARRFQELPPAATERIEAPVVYLAADFQGAEAIPASLRAEPRLRLIACGDAEAARNADAAELAGIEFLPDAVVLESHWLRHSALRHQAERLRVRLGDGLAPEEFYLQARRAVYLADVLPRRGVRHLHACRSDTAVCVWLVKHLAGIKASVAVEESPAAGRGVVARVLADFDRVSNSDEKLRGRAGVPAGDALLLHKPPTHREWRLGPVRVKLRGSPPRQDRGPLERAWFEQIVQSLHA